jgi:hypothetical protein
LANHGNVARGFVDSDGNDAVADSYDPPHAGGSAVGVLRPIATEVTDLARFDQDEPAVIEGRKVFAARSDGYIRSAIDVKGAPVTEARIGLREREMGSRFKRLDQTIAM